MDRFIKIFFTMLAVSMMIIGTMAPAMAVNSKAYSFEDNLEVALPNVAYELPYVPGEILVQFNPGVSEAKINAMNSKNEATVTYTSPYTGFKILKIPKTKSVEEMIEIYSKNPNVKSASPNSIMYATTVPDDSYYSYQWNFKSDNGINVEPAWGISTGEGVIVAVLDSGVAQNAPDLAQTSFTEGKDFVNNDDDPSDDNGHGTHVTGTIAQSTNNGEGVAGIAYDCSIMPVKVLNKKGSGTLQQLVDGIYYASNNGADVISMSLGWPPEYDPDGVDGILDNALDYANNEVGVTIVAAAGNDKTGIVSYPAADDNCIAVGATRYDGTLAYYSNYGEDLDVVAPGGDMNVDQNNDGYGDGILQNTFGRNPIDFGYYFYQGTSMATPHVAGVAALLISKYPDASNDQIRDAIEFTASNGPNGWNSTYGYGLIDAEAALNYMSSSTPPTNTQPIADAGGPYYGTIGTEVLFDGSASIDSDGSIVSYSWNFGDGSTDTGAGVSPTHTYDADGIYTVTLTVTDNEGATDTDTGDVNIVSEISQPEVTVTIEVGDPIPTKTAGTNTFAYSEATITITNSDGPVPGAVVSGHWDGLTVDIDTNTTAANGETVVSSNVAKYPTATTNPDFRFLVDSVYVNDVACIII